MPIYASTSASSLCLQKSLGLLLSPFLLCLLTHAIPAQGIEAPTPDADEAEVPEGYAVEIVVKGLTYPTSVEFDNEGTLFIAEAGYSYGDSSVVPRILKMNERDQLEEVTRDLEGPVTDLLWHGGKMYVSHRGKISVIENGMVRDLVVDLPSDGDHHNNQMSVGPDGMIYFGQGTATNSGVVGPDNYRMGWLQDNPQFHDLPAQDITLRGQTFTSDNPLTEDLQDQATTGAFQPFGSTDEQTIPGVLMASGTILRMNADGSGLEAYAWGLRNPYGVLWTPEGKLYATENGFDDRGSRPIANDKEDLYLIRQGAWYGWPDFGSGQPITEDFFRPPDGPAPTFLLAEHPPVEQPLATFPEHAAATKLDVSPGRNFGHKGKLFISFFGDMTPVTGTAGGHGGHRVVVLDPATGAYETFFEAKTLIEGVSAGPQRLVDVRFSPEGDALYVVDFGTMFIEDMTPMPVASSGVLWKITRSRPGTWGETIELWIQNLLNMDCDGAMR